MNPYRRVLLLVVIVFAVIQFVQPTKNRAEGLSENDISKTYPMPDQLHNMLITKCYDCHSNNTNYPWYAYIQPIGWWLAAHVHEGKEELNFSEFKTYSPKRASHKLEELREVAGDKSMPLKAYTYLHGNTEITPEDEAQIKAWLQQINFKP